MATDIFVGSVAVGVVPDARGFQNSLRDQLVPSAKAVGVQVGHQVTQGIVQSMNAAKPQMADAGAKSAGAFADTFKQRLRAALKALPEVKLKADATDADAKLADIRVRMEALSNKTIGVDITADKARAEMEVLEKELSVLGKKGVSIDVRIDADKARAQLVMFRKEMEALDPATNVFDRIAGKLKTISNQSTGLALFDKIFLGINLAAGILEPAVASLSVAFMGLVSGLSAAALGLGAFGIVAVGVFKQALTGAQAYMKAQQALDLATTKAQRVAALQAEKKALDGMTQSQRQFVFQLIGVQHEWNKFIASVSPGVLGVASEALAQFPKILGLIKPFLVPIETALHVIMRDMEMGLANPKLLQNVNTFATASAPMLVRSYNIVKNILVGIGGLLRAFLPEAAPVFAGLQKLTGRFADWGKAMGPGRSGFQALIKMAHTDGPLLVSILANIAVVLKEFISAMASQTTVGNSTQFLLFLRELTDILRVLMSQKWLANLVIWALIFQAALGKLAPVISLVGKVIENFGTIVKIATGITKAFGIALDFVAANPVVLIIAAIVAIIAIIVILSLKSSAFRDFWKRVWHDILAIMQDVWHWLQRNWPLLVGILTGPFGLAAVLIAQHWNTIWNNTIARAIRGFNDLKTVFNNLMHWVINFFANAISWLYNGGYNIMIGLWNGLKSGWNFVWGWFTRIEGWVQGIFSGAINWLVNAGGNIITGLLNGMKNAMADIGNWVNNNIVQPVLHWVKSHFGIASPAAAMIPIGKNIVAGMLHGIIASASDVGGFIAKAFGGWPQALGALISKSLIDVAKLPEKALKALGGLGSKIGGFFSRLFGGGKPGGGVQQWAGLVAQALAMLGLPLSLTSQVLYQMQTESGGNPNAINLTDINAQMGDPSRGLLQVIGSTFAAYHVPGTSGNIYDPLANIAAAINYALHTYGPTLMRGGMGMGSGHGYDTGGWLPPGVTLAYNMTGRSERVLSHAEFGSLTRGGDGAEYHAHFDGLTGQAIEGHVRTAFQAMSLTQGALQRQGRRR